MSYNKVGDDTSLIDHDFIESDEVPVQEPVASSNVQPVIKPQIETRSHMFQINFYRQYFDLNTEDFFFKIKNALNIFDKTSAPVDTDSDDKATELYGFVWITGSLIFLMFVSSTGSNLLANWLHPKKKHEYQYDFDLLILSLVLFYGYNIFVPLVIYAATSWLFKFPHSFSLTKLISIFGYTNILWVPITVINVLIVLLINNDKHHTLLNALEWIIVALSGVVTGISNITKISPVLERNCLTVYENDLPKAKNVHRLLLLALVASHVIFTVVVKISFFGISV